MTPLARRLRDRIQADGPVTVADFMATALGDPEHGYYMHRDPLGRAGDFTTAPEIGQVFGEMIGLWAAAAWQAMGAPDPVRLVELGPGRGTLMADALRAARALPAFADAVRVHLVETSPALRASQKAALAAHDPTWHGTFAELPEGPAIILANEFFDALPVHQYERHGADWRERLVGLAEGGEALCFVTGPVVDPGAIAAIPAPSGAVLESCPAGRALAGDIGARLARAGGVALIVDYGPDRRAPGESLQAVRDHAARGPLAEPGEADLTAHVDFQTLAGAARAAGAGVQGPVPQGAWLRRIGIETRAGVLLRKANARQAKDILAALHRLTAPDQMGALFKTMAITAPDLPPLAGFEPDAETDAETAPETVQDADPRPA